MAAPVYISWNAVTTALTAQMAGTSLAGALKTVLQVKNSSCKIRIVEWGFFFTGTLPTAPVTMELLTTGTVNATVTSGAVHSYNDTSGTASLATLSTSATGFSASAEGTITATRLLAQRADTQNFVQQFPLGREPEVATADVLRIRGNGTATVVAYVCWEE